MIKLHIGQPGCGKTKILIENANQTQKTAKGVIVFIDESDEGILELHHDIRYIDISKFPIESSQELVAFLYGLMSSNSDIEKMYLDGILNLFIMTDDEICQWLQSIERLSQAHQVAFEISVSHIHEPSECLKAYLVS